MIILIVSLILFVVVMGYLDSRLRWPKPTEKVRRYVSVAERSKGLRRD
jgi:hypothetical protein